MTFDAIYEDGLKFPDGLAHSPLSIDDIIATTVKNRSGRLAENAVLRSNLFDDLYDLPMPVASLHQRIISKLRTYQTRVRNSWAVLIGQAEAEYY